MGGMPGAALFIADRYRLIESMGGKNAVP